MVNSIQRNLLVNRLNKYLGRKLDVAVKIALDSILENDMKTGFQYKLEANLKQRKTMVVRSMRVSYVDLFETERDASQYVTTFFNTYSGTVIQSYLYKKKYYKTPHDGIIYIPQGEITDYSPNGGVYGFKVDDRYFFWDYSEELYYDLYNRVYSSNREVIIGARTSRYVKEAYKKLAEVRIKHPKAYLEHINRYGANEMVINHSNTDGLLASMSGGFYDGSKDFSITNFPEPSGVGAYTPVVGSLWNATHDFQDGDYGWAAFNTAMAVSDVFLVNSIRKGIMKGGLKAITMGNKPWNHSRWYDPTTNYSRFYHTSGFAGKNIPIHHSFLYQNMGVGKHTPNFIKNQIFNLRPITKRVIKGIEYNGWEMHRAIHGRSRLLELNSFQRFRYGTPTWIYSAGFSTFGRGTKEIKKYYE